jgi:hypothetical protein
MSTDDYFVNRVDTPKFPDGSYDFDNFETVDHALMERDIMALINGEEVNVPEYNFVTGLREYNGKILKLEQGSILLIEGIHALNPALTSDIPEEAKFRIFINTLTGIRQRIFTSATHAVPIAPWTGFHDYQQLDFGSDQKEPERLKMYQVKSPVPDKLETLDELLLCLLGQSKEGATEQAIVFANYREAAERIAHYLSAQGIENALYHGGLDQEMRDKSIIRLRGGSISVLVSTDLASRGLDLPDVAHIIHYHFPQSQEAYTHRNGRTARAGASGTAYVIVGPEETLPEFFPTKLPFYSIRKHPEKIGPAPMVTVYIGRGKKEKISRGDVVGFFTKNGGLTGADLGRIDIMDHCSYVAIRREKAEAALAKVKGLKIKGEKTHYLIVTGS